MGCKLKGAKDRADTLEKFPDKVAQRAGRTGIRRGAVKLRTKARRAAPKLTGLLRKSLTIWMPSQRFTATRGIVAQVKIRRAKKGDKNPPNYYNTLESGRAPHTRLGSPRAGSPQMKRFAFWDRAIEEAAPEATQIVIDETKKAIAREAGKAFAKSLRAGR